MHLVDVKPITWETMKIELLCGVCHDKPAVDMAHLRHGEVDIRLPVCGSCEFALSEDASFLID